MSIIAYRSIDIENAVRLALSDRMTAYCRPLPADYALPNILISSVGGQTVSSSSGKGKIDTFTIVIDSRANTEEEAMTCLRNALAVLDECKDSGFSYVKVNALYSWGNDPVRPDIAMCSATVQITAHREQVVIN